MDHSQTVLYVLAFVLSLVFSGFFAGSETALVALGRIDLQAMRERGDRRGAIIRNLKAHTSRLLAVILIGQNLFLSAASASATTLATGWFGARYGVILSVLFSTIDALHLRRDDAQGDRRGLARRRRARGRHSR